MADYWITSIDNPWNPFTHFKEWLLKDNDLGYNTCGWLASLSVTSGSLEEEDILRDVDYAAERFLDRNPFGVHYKVYREEADTLIPLLYGEYAKLSVDGGSKL